MRTLYRRRKVLAVSCLTALVGFVFLREADRATIEFLFAYALPAGMVCLLLLWRVLDPTAVPAKQPPLRVLLMRNVLQKHERRSPVPVTPSRLFQRRWDSKKPR